MKSYKLDEDITKPNWENTKTNIWVEEIIKVFGEILYTEKYKLMSKRKLKKMGYKFTIKCVKF